MTKQAPKPNTIALTPKQEKFCQSIASGLSQIDSYRSAYSAGKMIAATMYTRAGELMRNSRITARVAALRAPVVAAARYDLAQAMAEAKQAFDVGQERGNAGAMVAAVTLRAKLCGLLLDRKEIVVSPLDGLSYSDLQDLMSTLVGPTTH